MSDEDNHVSYLHKYFPSISKEKRSRLQYDEVGLYSISPPRNAQIITSYITQYFKDTNIIVTDAMAGIGGNTLSFASNLYYVNSIEYDETRFKCLISNIALYNKNNVLCLNTDYMTVMHKLQQHVIFLDPPWGGKSYKENESMTIDIGDISLNTICDDIVNNKLCLLLILKLPLNYDINSFSDKIKEIMIVDRLPKILIINIRIN